MPTVLIVVMVAQMYTNGKTLKIIQLDTCSLLYVNFTSIKLLKINGLIRMDIATNQNECLPLTKNSDNRFQSYPGDWDHV